jgi:hypothetical protein
MAGIARFIGFHLLIRSPDQSRHAGSFACPLGLGGNDTITRVQRCLGRSSIRGQDLGPLRLSALGQALKIPG